jgi:hypothetical protein
LNINIYPTLDVLSVSNVECGSPTVNMNNNKSSSSHSSHSSHSNNSSRSVTKTSNRNAENDDDDESSFDHNYIRVDKNKVHPLAYILRISRYGKFMTKLQNELVQNIQQIDKEVNDMQRMMEQKGMKRSSRTGMAWVRRMESKMVEIKSLKISLNVLPKILKIEESNKKKYMLLTTWQRSLNLASLDDDGGGGDGDGDDDDDNNDKDVIDAEQEQEQEDHTNSSTRKKKKIKRSSRQRLLLDRKKQLKSKLNNNNSSSSSSNDNKDNTKKLNDNNDNDNDNGNDKTDYGRLLHRFMAPCVYASQHIETSSIVSLQHHRNRITERYRQAKNQNKDMSTIVQEDLPSTSEKIQNFIGDYYCLCSGCQTMYNKQYKHLFGSYESHNEDMTATGKFFCVDCWNYYLNGKKKHVDELKEKEKEKENNNNSNININSNSNVSSSDNNSKNNDDDIIISSNTAATTTTTTTCTENGSTDGIDDISSQQQQPTKKARKKKKKKKKKKANNDDDGDGDGDDGDGNQKETPFIEENEHIISTNHFEIDDTSHQISDSEKITSNNSCDGDEPPIKQHVAFSNNDKWVDFLLQTGSIIALNDYMNEILGAED